MSLNIVDTFLEKLYHVSKDKNIPFGKKLTGSQNFLGTNYISQSIPTDFQTPFTDDEYFSHNKLNRSSSLDSKMNFFNYIASTDDRLVSRVAKLLPSPPMLSSEDQIFLPDYLKLLREQELFINQGFKIICKEVEQHFENLNKTLDRKVDPGKNTSRTSSVENPCQQTNKVSDKSDKSTQQINLPCAESTTNQSNELKSPSKSNSDTCLQSSLSVSVEITPGQTKVMNSYLESGKDINHRPDFSSIVKNPSKEITMQDSTVSPFKSNSGICLQSSLSASVEITPGQTKVMNSYLESGKDANHRPDFSSVVRNPSKEITIQDSTVSPVLTAVSQENKKQLANKHAMNEKLTNRKNKELQKRSKKRRRRQRKNNNKVPSEDCATKAEGGKLKNEATANASSGARTSPNSVLRDSGSKRSDILCDIVSGVQILLPNSSSFVISIESAEDDSDWDANSDCEWLNDCSEFEFSGIFISNLSAPLTSTSSKGVCISQLSVSTSPSEEVEMHRLGAVLRRVNDNWVKAMKGLETKPRVATKVSFAPDDELVEVVHVDVFDRKGEWETYAIERMRFKRRIDEVEKVISPCLSKQHREKIFSRFQKSDL